MNEIYENEEIEEPDTVTEDAISAQPDLVREEIEPHLLLSVIEAVLFASGEPLSLKQLQKAATHPEYKEPEVEALKAAITQLQAYYSDRGIELQEVGSGYRFQIKPQYARWVSQLWEEKPPRYSRALLETLVLIAYRQPITRAEIEDVRGVAVSTNIIKTLMERGWIRVVGHRDVPGHPSLYATTKLFLDYFNLPTLESLPTLEAVRDLDSIASELGAEFEQALAEALSEGGATETAEESEEARERETETDSSET